MESTSQTTEFQVWPQTQGMTKEASTNMALPSAMAMAVSIPVLPAAAHLQTSDRKGQVKLVTEYKITVP